MEGKYEFIQKVNKEVFFEIFIFFFSFRSFLSSHRFCLIMPKKEEIQVHGTSAPYLVCFQQNLRF